MVTLGRTDLHYPGDEWVDVGSLRRSSHSSGRTVGGPRIDDAYSSSARCAAARAAPLPSTGL
jgi:hypothetical protein